MKPEEEAAAIRAAKGPLGERTAKFPLLFAKPAYFGPRPNTAGPIVINNGTATLTDLGSGPLLVTCQHVISGFRHRREEEAGIIFQVGELELDVEEQLIDESPVLDLATIQLTDTQAEQLVKGGEIGSCYFRPVHWPPDLLSEDDFISFGGFPGSLRKLISYDDIEFPTWSCGTVEVSSVSQYAFFSAFQRKYWVLSFGDEANLQVQLGG